jgi:hypothetical protein
MTTPGVAVAEGDAPNRPATERRWMPVIVVVALIGLVVGGAQLVSSAVAPDAQAALRIGTAVQLQPLPGWEAETVTTTPPTVRLHRGPIVLDVLALEPEPAGPATVAARYVAEHLQVSLTGLAYTTPDPTALANGVPAVRLSYVGSTADGRAVEGIVVAAASTQASVVFDVSAPSGELVTAADDVRVMIDHAVLE